MHDHPVVPKTNCVTSTEAWSPSCSKDKLSYRWKYDHHQKMNCVAFPCHANLSRRLGLAATMCGLWCWQAYEPEMRVKFEKLTAAAKGFLCRRLLHSDKVQELVKTIKVGLHPLSSHWSWWLQISIHQVPKCVCVCVCVCVCKRESACVHTCICVFQVCQFLFVCVYSLT